MLEHVETRDWHLIISNKIKQSLLGGGEATETSGCRVCRINGLFLAL